MYRFVLLVSVTLLVTAVIGSCGKEKSPSGDDVRAGDAFGVRKGFGAGPVRFTVELSARSITTADALTCRLTLDVADGYEAEFPDLAFPDDLPGAVLTAYDERQAVEGNRRLDMREYELEPEYEGTLKWPAMQVYYHRAGEVEEDLIETEPVEVLVESTPETAQALELKPVRGLVTVCRIDAEQRRRWPWLLGGLLALAGVVFLIVHLVRRPRPAPPPRPAHEVALERLRQLAGRDLIATTEVEPFFVEVTGIVRDYIEQAFGVRAPEQTTEEFLSAMVAEPVVARHRPALEPFLTAADEVKFACSRPDMAAMHRAFDTAENFVLRSAGAGENGK